MTASVIGHNGAVRLGQAEARRILDRITGAAAPDALHALRFAPGTVCPPIAAIVDQAVVTAQRQHGLHAAQLVVAGGTVTRGQTVVRVRRLAHGKADWISTETTDVRVELRGAG